MAKKRFDVIYAPEIMDHLRVIDRKHHGLIRRTIEEHLFHQPHVETRNRKPLVRPSIGDEVWELRFGQENEFRVFYRAHLSEAEVHILAVGVKRGNRLYVGGEEIDL